MMNRQMRREARRGQTRRTPADPTAVFRVIGASRETDPGIALNTAVKLAAAFATLREGSADDSLFDDLACAINVGLVRAEQIDPLLEGIMLAARDAMLQADDIRGRHGRYGFTGPGLQAMAEALDAYDAILRASTPHQMNAALRVVIARTAAQLGERHPQ
jgi:hypothetical protein